MVVIAIKGLNVKRIMVYKFSGVCYRCGHTVEPFEGHYERHREGWRVQHATCAVMHKVNPEHLDAALKRVNEYTLKIKAKEFKKNV